VVHLAWCCGVLPVSGFVGKSRDGLVDPVVCVVGRWRVASVQFAISCCSFISAERMTFRSIEPAFDPLLSQVIQAQELTGAMLRMLSLSAGGSRPKRNTPNPTLIQTHGCSCKRSKRSPTLFASETLPLFRHGRSKCLTSTLSTLQITLTPRATPSV
jgi:hypothetical protein